jgi:hypothetical protein
MDLESDEMFRLLKVKMQDWSNAAKALQTASLSTSS